MEERIKHYLTVTILYLKINYFNKLLLGNLKLFWVADQLMNDLR